MTVTLRFVGDLALARDAARVSSPLLVDTLFGPAEGPVISFANFEAAIPLDNAGAMPKPEFEAQTEGRLVRNRAVYLKALASSPSAVREMGFDVVSVANNHSMDFGEDSFEHTVTSLKQAGVGVCGEFSMKGRAEQPTVVERGGLRIGFLGYNFASDIRTQILRDIRRCRAQVDCLVVSMHWNLEGMPYPMPRSVEVARLITAAGADLVIGHHPHVIHGTELVEGRLIAYSLGNFIFDDLQRDGFDIGLGLEVEVNQLGLGRPKWVPLLIHPERYLPAVLSGSQAERVLETLAERSIMLTDNQHPLRRMAERAEANMELLNAQLALTNPAYRLSILRRLHRIRWRHVVTLWKYVWRKWR